MNEIINLGVGGAVVILVIKEMFQFLKGNGDSKGLIAISRTLENSIMMLELMQERQKDHESNAKDRHSDMVKFVGDHSKDCRGQAEKIREILNART